MQLWLFVSTRVVFCSLSSSNLQQIDFIPSYVKEFAAQNVSLDQRTGLPITALRYLRFHFTILRGFLQLLSNSLKGSSEQSSCRSVWAFCMGFLYGLPVWASIWPLSWGHWDLLSLPERLLSFGLHVPCFLEIGFESPFKSVRMGQRPIILSSNVSAIVFFLCAQCYELWLHIWEINFTIVNASRTHVLLFIRIYSLLQSEIFLRACVSVFDFVKQSSGRGYLLFPYVTHWSYFVDSWYMCPLESLDMHIPASMLCRYLWHIGLLEAL